IGVVVIVALGVPLTASTVQSHRLERRSERLAAQMAANADSARIAQALARPGSVIVALQSPPGRIVARAYVPTGGGAVAGARGRRPSGRPPAVPRRGARGATARAGAAARAGGRAVGLRGSRCR